MGMSVDGSCGIGHLIQFVQVDIVPDEWNACLVPCLGDACTERKASQWQVGNHERQDLSDFQGMSWRHESMSGDWC